MLRIQWHSPNGLNEIAPETQSDIVGHWLFLNKIAQYNSAPAMAIGALL